MTGVTDMLDRLETRFATASLLRRLLMVWAATGALVHAAIPALHAAATVAGPVALWLWVLPLSALALVLMASGPSDVTRPTVAAAATAVTRRRRGAAVQSRAAISRRDRPRSPSTASPVAPRVRRAG